MQNVQSLNIIDNLVARLKEFYKPDLVILFGSRARGEFSEESDLDLLIVKNTKKSPLWRRVEVRKILSTEIPLDVIVYTPREFDHLKESESAFIKEILDEGRVIYEKK
ncbi:MAG: nucleotidyltransferase domain-containing protein [Candidatus Marinimicrobia bacterium]|nr:nucleotidyltransferase domain-containing protein [Candidatus Neomarinimicrobiota bacterium]